MLLLRGARCRKAILPIDAQGLVAVRVGYLELGEERRWTDGISGYEDLCLCGTGLNIP